MRVRSRRANALLSVLVSTLVGAAVLPAVPLPAGAAATEKPRVGEDPALRTAASRSVRNADGTITRTLFARPIHFEAANGWEPIDSSVVPSGNPQFPYRNKANSFSVKFRSTTTGDFVRLRTAGPEVGLALLDGTAAPAAVDGSRVTYARPLPGTDLRYDVTATELKETLVLADRTAPSTFRFRLSSPDGVALTAEPTGAGEWEVSSAAHDGTLFVIEPMWAAEQGWDGEAKPDADPHVTTSVTPAEGGLDVVVQVDREWLSAPGASSRCSSTRPSRCRGPTWTPRSTPGAPRAR